MSLLFVSYLSIIAIIKTMSIQCLYKMQGVRPALNAAEHCLQMWNCDKYGRVKLWLYK